MGQKIEIIRAEEHDWYNVGEIYELSTVQEHVTKGVEVVRFVDGKVENTEVWLIKHGDYKEHVGVSVDTTTEELVFIIEIKDKIKGPIIGMSVLTDYVISCTEQIQNQTNLSFEWTIESKQLLTSQASTSRGCYQITTIKDSHFHMNTTLWTQACLDFVCLLQQKMSEADIRAYSTPIRLYSFIQK